VAGEAGSCGLIADRALRLAIADEAKRFSGIVDQIDALDAKRADQ
jgi:hypothetical protein